MVLVLHPRLCYRPGRRASRPQMPVCRGASRVLTPSLAPALLIAWLANVSEPSRRPGAVLGAGCTCLPVFSRWCLFTGPLCGLGPTRQLEGKFEQTPNALRLKFDAAVGLSCRLNE